MDQYMAHSDGAPQGCSARGQVRCFLRQLAERLTNNLELAFDRGPQHRVGKLYRQSSAPG
jgi:hypothetical protein